MLEYITEPMAAEIENARMAGFFEGEGHTGICKSTRSDLHYGYDLFLQVTVTNKDKGLVEPFLEYGGRLIICRKQKPAWRWYIYGKKAITFLQAIEPYLKGVKAKQVVLAVEFQSLKGKQGQQISERDWEAMNQLRSEINSLNAKKGYKK